MSEVQTVEAGSPHGTYADYRAGCRCAACRAANTAHVTAWRVAYRTRRPPLGSYISAREAWRIVERLLCERFTRQRIAREALGQRERHLTLRLGERVTRRTLMRLRRYARRWEV